MSFFMKNGIFREDEGFHVMVDGVDRVFSEDKSGAFELARNLKRTNRQSIIEIRDRANGAKVMMLDDGRIR
jgi:hypothetical protein